MVKSEIWSQSAYLIDEVLHLVMLFRIFWVLILHFNSILHPVESDPGVGVAHLALIEPRGELSYDLGSFLPKVAMIVLTA